MSVLFDLLDHVPTRFEGMPFCPTAAGVAAAGFAATPGVVAATGTPGVVSAAGSPAAGATPGGVVVVGTLAGAAAAGLPGGATATPCASTSVAPSVRSAAPNDTSMVAEAVRNDRIQVASDVV